MGDKSLGVYGITRDSINDNYGWDGFLTHTSDEFANGVADLNTGLQSALDDLTKDPSNPANLAAYQSLLSEYTLYRNAQSNVVKVYKDVGSAIIQNFR